MKKLKVLGLAAAAAGMVLLTSCMDGNNTQTGTIYGVVDYSKDFKKIVKGLDGGTYFVPTINNDINFNTDECVAVYGTIDYSSPENANASTYGYFTMSALDYVKYNTYDENYFNQQDTVGIHEGEMAFSAITGIAGGYYVNNYVFMSLQSLSVQPDQKTQFRVSFDPNVKTEQGKRVYDLYLRAQKTEDGKIGSQLYGFIVPVKMNSFIGMATSQEQAQSQSKEDSYINVRLNYIKEFNADTTSAVWTTSPVFALPMEKRE